jgi:peptidoglycan/LPS O-acetylase OafA/YrhL
LLFCTLNEQSNTQLVVVGFFILFAGGAVIRLNEQKINVRLCGIFAATVFVFLYAPVADDFTARTLEGIALPYGPTVSFGMLRWYISLVALPFLIIFLARYFPLSFPLKHDYSYGLYVFAWPAQQIVTWYSLKWKISIDPVGLFFASGLITLALAVASWHLIEGPALRISHRSETKRRKDVLDQGPDNSSASSDLGKV